MPQCNKDLMLACNLLWLRGQKQLFPILVNNVLPDASQNPRRPNDVEFAMFYERHNRNNPYVGLETRANVFSYLHLLRSPIQIVFGAASCFWKICPPLDLIRCSSSVFDFLIGDKDSVITSVNSINSGLSVRATSRTKI